MHFRLFRSCGGRSIDRYSSKLKWVEEGLPWADFHTVLQNMAKGFLLVPFFFRMHFYGIIFSAVVTFPIGFTDDVFRTVAELQTA
jgi:hypothetical protein